MRILVIGGTGFVGRHVVRSLHERGHNVIVYHRGIHEPTLPDGIRHIHSELAAFPLLAFPEEITRDRYDVVVHMMLTGDADTRAALNALRGRAPRIVVASSGDVYAAHGQIMGKAPAPQHPSARLDESASLREELYPYGRSVPSPWGGEMRDYDKILVERLTLGDSGIAGTIVRCPAVYGPHDPHHRFAGWTRCMDDRRPAILLGEAKARWRFTHGFTDNVAEALAVAAVSERAAGRIYNYGEEPTPTMAERARQIGDVLGWTGEIVSLPEQRLPLHLRDPYSYAADLAYDTTRIRRELGYVEPVPYGEALRRTLAWERETPTPASVLAMLDYAAEDRALASPFVPKSAVRGTRVSHLVRDLRIALRSLRRRPLFTALIVLTLALGIGANTAIFSVVNGVLLRPLPYQAPERLALIWSKWTNFEKTWVSTREFFQYRQQGQLFQDVAAWGDNGNVALTGDQGPESVSSAYTWIPSKRQYAANGISARLAVAVSV